MTPEQLVALLQLLADMRLQITAQANRITELERALAVLRMPEDGDKDLADLIG